MIKKINNLLRKAKKFLVTLRVSILSIFISFFILTILLLISFSYYRFSETMMFVAKQVMNEISENVINHIDNELVDAAKEGIFVGKIIQGNILKIDSQQALKIYMLEILKKYPLIQDVFWSDEKGNFYEIIKESQGQFVSQVIIRDRKPANQTVIYHDEDMLKPIETLYSNDVSYDPRERIWYKDAKLAKKMIWTDIYIFEQSKQLGITTAIPVFENNQLKGVFGLASRLSYLSDYLATQKVSPNGVVFILSKEGKVIAYPHWEEIKKTTGELLDAKRLPRSEIAKSFEIYQKRQQSNFYFYHNGTVYLAHYDQLPNIAQHGWLVGIVAPENDFIAELKKTSIIDAIFALTIALLGILCVSNLVTRVVTPLKKLVVETEKIKQFELEDETPIHSRIKEIVMLTDAIHTMKKGLKSFQKYVPASLVRELIEADEHARIGGTKKNLTVLFSDIENFTTISEKMDPNALMEHMCEYFDEMSRIIVQEKGTIDKYIGDSIMTFWGAPFTVKDPNTRAARTALKCKKQLKFLNSLWEKKGKNPLITRFGIHAGDAIVGNVGSSERINYTALGDTINLASRLEGLNKHYGTQILVSEVVYEMIKNQFILRKVDCVAVKGKTEGRYVYELLAENKDELIFDLASYENVFEKAFSAYQHGQWDVAIAIFKTCLQIYPDDTLAPVFIHRSKKFKNHPPAKWNGTFFNS